MHYFRQDIVWFDDAKYAEKLKSATPDQLWERQCLKLRAKVSGGFSVGAGVIMVPFTMGLSTPGLALSCRAVEIARRKSKLVAAEVARRNLPDYETKRRDILIPLSISVVSWTTVGVIDALFLGGTGTPASASLGETLGAAFQQPGDLVHGAWEGFILSNQQFFLGGTEQVMLGTDALMSTIDSNGTHVLAPVTGMPGLDSAASAGIWTTDTAAGQGSLLATYAGTQMGADAAVAANKIAASALIQNTGLQGVRADIMTSAGPPIPPRPNAKAHNAESKPPTDENGGTDAEIQRQIFIQALTGKQQRHFVFLGEKFQPISQRIVALPCSQRCRHDIANKISLRTCAFCTTSINPEIEAFYHCCECRDRNGVDICEPCVAGRGSSCTKDRTHILARKGFLSGEINYGLVGNGRKKWMKGKKGGEETRAGLC